jgi:hypothetical protein
MGIEPMTSPLPRECSTTEPLEQRKILIHKNLIDRFNCVNNLVDFIL